MIGILAPGLEGFDRLVKRFDILSRWLYEKSLDELEKAKIKGGGLHIRLLIDISIVY
jgi:hypothetical protein